jgi:hypothetical protein
MDMEFLLDPCVRRRFRMKWVVESHSGAFKMAGIAGHYCQIVNECDGSDLPVDNVLVVDAHEVSPSLGTSEIEGKNALRIPNENELEPVFDHPRLRQVASPLKRLNAASDLADDLNGEKQCLLCAKEEVQDLGIGSGSLAGFTDYIRIDKEHG